MRKPVVLVAEDDPSVRMTIEFVLQDEGFEVVLASDGEEALRLARKLEPDVILLDQMMPKLDGRDVLTGLRENDATRETPVFVLSGMARTKGDWPGAQFVGKPFSPDDLVDRIRKAIAPH
jgi:two-component system, OmpR family, alkaline phosphatase synthesis response regulator PhoP